MLRALAVAGGVAGAAALSQFPEFSQQYLQRLAGQVDAMALLVAEFDATAAANGLTRDAALAELRGTPFLIDRRTDLERAFARHDRLAANLAALRAASPLERMAMPHRLADPETLRATWADFRPAVPVTADGGISALVGYFAGWLGASAVLGLLSAPFRRRRTA